MLTKKIQITSIEDLGNRFVLKDENGDKYSCWKTKQDGTPTKAIQTFQNQLGEVEIYYKSEEKDYKGHNYTARTILSFKTPSGSVPRQNTHQTPTSYQKPLLATNLTAEAYRTDMGRVNLNIQKLVAKIQELEKRLGGVETWIEGAGGKQGLELHQALEDPKIKELNDEIPIVNIINDEEVKIEDIPL